MFPSVDLVSCSTSPCTVNALAKSVFHKPVSAIGVLLQGVARAAASSSPEQQNERNFARHAFLSSAAPGATGAVTAACIIVVAYASVFGVDCSLGILQICQGVDIT